MQYIVLDLEWNQALSKESVRRRGLVLSGEIIQIGAVRLGEDLSVEDSLRIAVAPQFYKKMHWSVRKLTGISTQSLAKGLPFPEAYEQFMAWCGEDFVFLTWGPDDIPMLTTNMRIHNIPVQLPKSYDLQKIYSRTVSGEKRQCSLADALQKLGITETEPAHDALNDALNTAQICARLPLSDAIAHYEEPVTLKTVPSERPAGEETEYESCEDMFRQNDKPIAPCPACGEPVQFGKWVRRSAGRRSTMAQCLCGQAVVMKLRWLEPAEGETAVTAFRLVEKASAEQMEAYQRALKRHRKRRSK